METLLDDNRRVTMAATIDAVHSRVMKERRTKTDKGMSLADVAKELGSEEAHKGMACMKEVSAVPERCRSPYRWCVLLYRWFVLVCGSILVGQTPHRYAGGLQIVSSGQSMYILQ